MIDVLTMIPIRWRSAMVACCLCASSSSHGLAQSAQVDTVVEAIRELDPQTPAELLSAVENLLNVGAHDLAKEYFGRLTEQEVTTEQLTELYRQFGPAALLQLSRDQTLAPQGTKFATKVFDAVDAWARDTSRLEALLPALDHSEQDVRTAAIHSFAEGQAQAAVVLLRALSDPASKLRAANLQDVWLLIGPPALGPVLAGMYSSDERLQQASLSALAGLRLPQSVPYLAGFVSQRPDPALQRLALDALQQITRLSQPPTDTRGLLYQQVIARLGPQALDRDHGQRAEAVVWSWSDDGREARSWNVPGRTAALMDANQLSYSLAKLDASYHDLFTVTELALWYQTGKPNQDGESRLAMFEKRFGNRPSAGTLAAILATAMDHEIPEAAVVASEMMSQLVVDPSAATNPLVTDPLSRALRSPNPDLRAAAALALMQLDPPLPFKGAADLLQTALQLATTGGQRRAIVIHPIRSQAEHLAGLLSSMGWQVDTANSGKRAMEPLIRSMDFELIMIGDDTFRPRYGELVQQLQFDFRTRDIPTVLFTTSREMHTLDELDARWPGIWIFQFPPDATALQQDLQQMGLDAEQTLPDVRLSRARAALEWLGKTAGQGSARSFYDLRNYDAWLAESLANPELTISAAAALGKLGTPTARQALRAALRIASADTEASRALNEALRESGR